ncbi:MAG: FG-GAP-like repeat-containing protein, partial [Planctomycetota bacterium]|nr:FG-GAP-like repeat-containing protein [Planctomycetota bacterium]
LAGMESQFVLEDGSFLALDVWNAPSTGDPPTVRSTCRNSLLLDDEQRAALRDRSIVCWRWRIHKPGAGGTFQAVPPPGPMGLPFYYDCDVRSNPPELAADCNENGIADGCEADCNRNGVPDDCDLRDGTSTDCDQNSLPDECDILPGKIDLAPAAEIRQVPEPANAVIALDLDGDDVPDLAVADGAPSVSVLLGTGGGAFGRPAVVPVGFPPEILVAADLDRDGAPDLIATRSGGFVPEQRVALLRNRGNGTFADPVMVEVAERPTTLVATDLNGDGAPDLVTGHRDLATLTVLLNDGSLAFSVAESPTLEEPAVSLAPLDLDGDGDRDLIAATGQRLTLLTNDGSGGLSVERTIELAFVPEIVGAADLDGDGRLDLVLGQAEPAVAHVMLGAAGGGFADPVAYGFHATTRDSDATPTADVETADVDGDGSLDLVMVSSLVRAATVMRGEGDGTFGVPENFPVGDPAAEIWEAALAVADIDVDGALDVVVALRSVDTFLLRNRSLPPSIVDCNANGIPDRCEIDSEPQVDSDGDGILDECVPVPFARADANSDGNVDLSDPVAILGYLFLGAPPPSCLTSADADDNGVVDLTDAIRLLNFLFLGGPRPAAPFGECGTDPTPDDLTCESFDGCP